MWQCLFRFGTCGWPDGASPGLGQATSLLYKSEYATNIWPWYFRRGPAARSGKQRGTAVPVLTGHAHAD